MADLDRLGFFPPPKTLLDHGGSSLPRPDRLQLSNQGDQAYAEAFSRGFSLAVSDRGLQSAIGREGFPLILLHAAIPREGYRISIRSDAISIEASSPASFQYAGTTFGQLLAKHQQSIPAHTIEDAPSFPVRGVMLDISRCKVPTMASLFELIDQLAVWKINHLQLYTEHTFAYDRHRTIWRDASPMTGEEIRRLDDYCRMLNIELVPNQNSFGHLHRWLEHPKYRHLAEAPEGYTTPWGEKRKKPFSLNPLLPESLEFLAGLYDELLPNFHSRLFNIGGDETFDLGQGASRAACDKLGKGRVYLNFLNAIQHLVEQRGHHMLFWGDIVLNHPELIPELNPDQTALLWGYESGHPFAEQCAQFAAHEIPYWVCPGTSTWNSLAGRLDNMLSNMQEAAEAGDRHGAGGMLITEWGDNGHWQTTPFSRLGMAAGAYTAWYGRAPEPRELECLFDHAPGAVRLANAYTNAGFSMDNNSPIFPLLRFKNPDKVLASWTPENLAACLACIEEQIEILKTSSACGEASSRFHDELLLTARMMRHAAARGIWLKNGQPAQGARELAGEAEQIIASFRALWLAVNRPGGLPESIAPLEERLREYRSAMR